MAQWISVEVNELYPEFRKVYVEKVLKKRKGLGDADEAVVADGRAGLAKPLDVLDARLRAASSSWAIASRSPIWATCRTCRGCATAAPPT